MSLIRKEIHPVCECKLGFEQPDCAKCSDGFNGKKPFIGV